MNTNNEINLALKEFSLGKKDSAYKKLKKIFKKNSDNLQLRFNLAVIEQSLNLNEEAKKNYLYLVHHHGNLKAKVIVKVNAYILIVYIFIFIARKKRS